MACRNCGGEGLPALEEIDRIAREVALSMSGQLERPPVSGPALSARIEACQKCEGLAGSVLCTHCGCFVAVRALDPAQKCPHPAGSRWGAAGDR